MAAPKPQLSELFWLFCRIGLTSFGGGTSSWVYREIVEKKRWMPEDEFFDTFALCQALPGINVTNIAVWTGRRLCGLPGALSACAGIVVIPSVLIVLLGIVVASFTKYPVTEIALGGATAAAVALPFTMGIRMGRNVRIAPVPLGVMVASFVGIGVLKLPLLWVAPVCALVSILSEHLRKDAAT